MKKILLITGWLAMITLAFTYQASAQPGATSASARTLTTTAFGNALDTVDNTEQHVTTPDDGKTSVWNVGVTAKVVTKKISGVVAGTLILQGSMDGTEWVDIGSAATITDGSKNYSFNTTVRWPYYRVSWTGSGTMSASMKCYLFWY